ncbi:hypothetical protein JXR93_02905 [bacterium]|nr:hypothetical protein [bacterium]
MRKVLFLLSIFVVFGCSNDPKLDTPCKGVSCSGQGACVVENNTPVCQCNNGYTNIGNECILDCKTISRSIPDIYNQKCVCEEGYQATYSGDELLSCSFGENCVDGYVFRNGKCELNCEDSFAHANESNNECICDDGYITINGACVIDCRYIGFSHPSDDNLSCLCDSGYQRVGDDCILICSEENTEADPSNTECVCKDDYYISNELGVCINPCNEVTCYDNAECKSLSFENFRCECTNNRVFTPDQFYRLFENEYDLIAPKLASTSTQTAILWNRANESRDRFQPYIGILDKNGDVTLDAIAIGDEEQVNPNENSQFSISTDGSNYLAVWRSIIGDDVVEPIVHIFKVRTVSSNGELGSIQMIRVQEENVVTDKTPKLVWNPTTSKYTLFWLGYVAGYNVLFMNSIDTNGTPEETIFSITNADESIIDYDISIDSDGNYGVTLLTRFNSYNRLFFEKISSANEKLVARKLIQYDNYSSTDPISIWDGENFLVAWRYSNYFRFTTIDSNGNKLHYEKTFYTPGTSLKLIWDGTFFTSFYLNGGEIYLYQYTKTNVQNNNTRVSYSGGNVGKFGTYQDYGDFLYEDGRFIAIWSDLRYGKHQLIIDQIGCY